MLESGDLKNHLHTDNAASMLRFSSESLIMCPLAGAAELVSRKGRSFLVVALPLWNIPVYNYGINLVLKKSLRIHLLNYFPLCCAFLSKT